MRQKYVMGNWKMNGTEAMAHDLLRELNKEIKDLPNNTECVVFPPAVYLPLTQNILAKTIIQWGAQNIYPALSGAYTGEISLAMIKDCGCKYVLVGHSERRHIFNESENFIREKFHQVKEHDMIPVLCVGETEAERKSGHTETVLKSQLEALHKNDNKELFANCIIAYEPVWAIGTGLTASPDEAEAAHKFIREHVATYNQQDAELLPILYGGSVNEKNAHSLFSMPNIDGGLVGGCSLKAKQFVEIVRCIK